jgi:hypothetical protein
MSLCPNYCECKPCEHHVQSCLPCCQCIEIYERREQQKEHEASVQRQKAKLRPLKRAAQPGESAKEQS